MPDPRAPVFRAWPLFAFLLSQLPRPASAQEHATPLSQMRQAAEQAAETEPPRLRLPGPSEKAVVHPDERSRRQAVHDAVTRELHRESIGRHRQPPAVPGGSEEASRGQGQSAQSRAEAAQAQTAKHGADVEDQRGKGKGKGNGNGNMNNGAQQVQKADVAAARDKGPQKGPGGAK